MTSTNAISFQQLHDVASRIESAFDQSSRESLLAILANRAKERIVTRTQLGLDVDSQSFIAYTPRYATYRQRCGLPTRVDLTFTGSMLRSIRSSINAEASTVFLKFGSQAESKKAFYLQTRHGRERIFFSLSHEDVNELIQLSRSVLLSYLRGALS